MKARSQSGLKQESDTPQQPSRPLCTYSPPDERNRHCTDRLPLRTNSSQGHFPPQNPKHRHPAILGQVFSTFTLQFHLAPAESPRAIFGPKGNQHLSGILTKSVKIPENVFAKRRRRFSNQGNDHQFTPQAGSGCLRQNSVCSRDADRKETCPKHFT